MTARAAPGPVVIAAGGTGGHVFPALALARALRAGGLDPAFVSDRRGIAFGDELAGVACHAVRASGLAGRGLAGALRGLIDLAIGTLQARNLLRRLAPSLAVGFGGYASVPPLLAASSLGVPTLIHEANAVLGRANRLLAPRARAIATAFADTARLRARDRDRAERTGNPVRADFVTARRSPYPELEADRPVRLLVVGGSQGARVFGRVVPAALAALAESLRRRIELAQQCRPEDIDAVGAAYERAGIACELAPFFDDLPARLARAHLVIARAGASTVAELACVGRPAIVVPYPHATDDHQEANARALEAAGGAWVIAEAALAAGPLAATIEQLLSGEALAAAAARARAFGQPDAAMRLATLAASLVGDGAHAEAAP